MDRIRSFLRRFGPPVREGEQSSTGTDFAFLVGYLAFEGIFWGTAFVASMLAFIFWLAN